MKEPYWTELKAPSNIQAFISSFEDEVFYLIENREN